jgi:hypothetical protein
MAHAGISERLRSSRRILLVRQLRVFGLHASSSVSIGLQRDDLVHIGLLAQPLAISLRR